MFYQKLNCLKLSANQNCIIIILGVPIATSTPALNFNPHLTSSSHPEGQGHMQKSNVGHHGNGNEDEGLVAEDDYGKSVERIMFFVTNDCFDCFFTV